MDKIRVLITGAGGMLGKDVVEVLSAHSSMEVHAVIRNRALNIENVNIYQLDLTDSQGLRSLLGIVKPHVIVHVAALVDLDQCEQNLSLARSIHAGATSVLVEFGRGSSRVIYISTDSVFDGVTGNYSENDVPNPVNAYTQTKLEGERVTLEAASRNSVLRANIYGFHFPPGNSLAEWAIRELKCKNQIFGFQDVFFNPLYTRQYAEIICADFVKVERYGIWHLGCDNHVSKYTFLVELANEFGFDQSFLVKSNLSSMKFKVPRPRKTALNTSKYRKATGRSMSLELGLKRLKLDILNHGAVDISRTQAMT